MNVMDLDQERQKALMLVTQRLFLFTLLSLTVIAAVFYLLSSFFQTRTYLALLVFATGLIGGFVSIQQRLPKAGLRELSELGQSWTSILLIPLNGGIFAMVLHIVFISGILKGPLFPAYSIPDFDLSNSLDFQNFLINTFPSTGEDVAKLFFWSFVAGFSERFVPQIIRKTVERAVPDSDQESDTRADGVGETVVDEADQAEGKSMPPTA